MKFYNITRAEETETMSIHNYVIEYNGIGGEHLMRTFDNADALCEFAMNNMIEFQILDAKFEIVNTQNGHVINHLTLDDYVYGECDEIYYELP